MEGKIPAKRHGSGLWTRYAHVYHCTSADSGDNQFVGIFQHKITLIWQKVHSSVYSDCAVRIKDVSQM